MVLKLGHAQEAPALAMAPDDPVTISVSIAGPGKLRRSVITRDQFQPLKGKERWGLYWHQTYWSPGAASSNTARAVRTKLNDEPT